MVTRTVQENVLFNEIRQTVDVSRTLRTNRRRFNTRIDCWYDDDFSLAIIEKSNQILHLFIRRRKMYTIDVTLKNK